MDTVTSHTDNGKECPKQPGQCRVQAGKKKGLAKPTSNLVSCRFTETCELEVRLPRNRLIWRGLQMNAISTHAGDLYLAITVPSGNRCLLCGFVNQEPTIPVCLLNNVVHEAGKRGLFLCLFSHLWNGFSQSVLWSLVGTISPKALLPFSFFLPLLKLPMVMHRPTAKRANLKAFCLPSKPAI